MKPAAIYARVSTDRCDLCGRSESSHKAGSFRGEPHEFKGQNPERQLRELRNYCQIRDWPYVEFVDRISGATKERPAFAEMWKKIDRGSFSALIVLEYDRFARSTIHLLNTLDELGKLKVEFVSVNQNIDTTKPEGRLFYTIIAGVAEYERAIMRRRIISGLENAKANGKVLGRKKLIIDIDRVKKMRDEEKLSIRQICAQTGLSKGTVERALK